MPMDKQLQQLAAQWLIAEIAISVIVLAVSFFLLYLTLRYAIRDGIRDAQQLDRRGTMPRERDKIAGPDLRAD
jgi:hypothetical protein